MKKKYLITVGLVGVLAASSSVYAASSSKTTVSNQSPVTVKTVQPSENTTTQSIESIKNKMLNAIDFYDSVKGTYKTVLKPLDVDETTNFDISEGSKKGSYIEKVNNKSGKVTEQKSDGQYIVLLDKEKKQYMKSKVANQNNFDKAQPRMYKDGKGDPVYVYRPNLAVADSASDVVFPQTYAFWLEDNAKIAGNDTFLGRNVTLIEGTLPTDIAQKHDATTFTMKVDSQTGVLLQLIEKNANGEITNSIEVTSIEFNGNVDNTKFSTDNLPSDFVNVQQHHNH